MARLIRCMRDNYMYMQYSIGKSFSYWLYATIGTSFNAESIRQKDPDRPIPALQ